MLNDLYRTMCERPPTGCGKKDFRRLLSLFSLPEGPGGGEKIKEEGSFYAGCGTTKWAAWKPSFFRTLLGWAHDSSGKRAGILGIVVNQLAINDGMVDTRRGHHQAAAPAGEVVPHHALEA